MKRSHLAMALWLGALGLWLVAAVLPLWGFNRAALVVLALGLIPLVGLVFMLRK